MNQTTLTIDLTGLNRHLITVDADSVVELVQHDAGCNVWYALFVDGRHYDLVMWKHTIGREELLVNVDCALNEVRNAIAALTPPVPTQPTTEIIFDHETKDYACYIDDSLVGFAKTYVAGEILINTTLTERARVAAEQRYLAKLAVKYGKLRSEGRYEEARMVKESAMRVQATALGISYSQFVDEHAAVVAEQQAA